MGNARTEQPTVATKTIKKALKSLESPLGMPAVTILMNEVETYGLPLVNDHYRYSIEEIEGAIRKILGQGAAALVLELLKKELRQ